MTSPLATAPAQQPPDGSPSPEKRTAALRQVLDSQAFARSEQLRNFLRYVCELEISGRGGEIKEYAIGVEALGRPSSYSTTADSSVRRRAFELRQKLDDVYSGELASSEVLIEIPKGSYVPVFRFRPIPLHPESAPEPAPPLPLPAAAPTSHPSGRTLTPVARAAISLVALAGILVGWAASRYFAPPSSRPHPILAEAWGPLVTSPSSVLICVATNFHLLVRPGFSASDLPVFPAPPDIAALYRKTNDLPAAAPLAMRPAPNVATLGVVGGVAAVSATLMAAGTPYQILPERSAPLASFRNRNVILFGDPLNSFAAAQLLSRGRLTIAQDAQTQRLVIRDRSQPLPAPPAFSRHEGRPGDPAEVYGLLTVLPTAASPGEQRRTLIVSGVSQVGIQGVMEFFSSPERLADLKTRFRQDGLDTFPRSYQLVVRCTAADSLPLSCGYAAHYILEK